MAKRKSLDDLREEMRAVARGERKASPLPALGVLGALSSQANFELLRIINQRRPESVSQLADMTGRAQPNVSRSLQELARHGLVRLVRQGSVVRPVPTTAEIDIDLSTGTYRSVPLVVTAK